MDAHPARGRGITRPMSAASARRPATGTASNRSTARCTCWKPSPRPAARRPRRSAREPHRPQHFDLPSSAGDADRSAASPPRCPAGGSTRSARASSISATPACRSICRAARSLIWSRQPRDRRDRASGGAAGRRGGHASGARSTPRRARRAPARSAAWTRRTPPRPARPSWPGCRKTRCAVSSAHGMKRFTDNTITDFPALIESLRVVRRNGYAIDREEFLPGVICVGAAIRDQAGTVIGAISASTPTMRASDEHVALMRDEIVAADARALGRVRRTAGRAASAPRRREKSVARIDFSQGLRRSRCASLPEIAMEDPMYAPAGVKTSTGFSSSGQA